MENIIEYCKSATMQIYGNMRTMHDVYETTVLDSLEDYDIYKIH